MTANQLESLLCKPVWDYKDVMVYCDCSPTTAYEIIQHLRGVDPIHKKEGWVNNFPKAVKRDAVLHYYDTEPNAEMGVAIIAKMVMAFIGNLTKVQEAVNG